MRRLLPYIAVVVAMVIWSVSGIAIQRSLVSIPPITMIILRFTTSVLIMLVLGLLFRRNTLLGIQPLRWCDLPVFLLGGVMQPFLYYLLETYTYQQLSSPTIAEALLSTSPLLAPLFASVLIHEHVSVYNIVGIVISTAGVLMLLLMGQQSFSIGNPWGVLLAFASVTAAILNTVALKRVPTYYSSLSAIFYFQIISLVLFYPLWAFMEGPSAFQQMLAQSWSELSVGLGCVLFLALGASVLAYIFFCYTVRQIGVTRTNAFNNIRPVFTALWMFLFMGEHLPWVKLGGIGLIIIGLFICQLQQKKLKS